jgi:hypothetical protein
MDGVNGLDFSDIDDFATALEMAGLANAMAAVHAAILNVPEPAAMVQAVVLMVGAGSTIRRRRVTNQNTSRTRY